MKKSICVIIYLLIVGYCYSQEVNLKLGINFSSLNFQKSNFFESHIVSPFAAISVDYLNIGNFYLSSELGFMKKGGKEKDVAVHLTEEQYELKDMKASWNYINFGTTVRYRLPLRNNYFWVGIGPNLDILVDGRKTFSNLGGSFVLKRTNVSAKAELGFEHKFESRVKLGFNLSYMYGLSYTGKIQENNFYGNSFSTSLLLGYSFVVY